MCLSRVQVSSKQMAFRAAADGVEMVCRWCGDSSPCPFLVLAIDSLEGCDRYVAVQPEHRPRGRRWPVTERQSAWYPPLPHRSGNDLRDLDGPDTRV